MKWSAEITNNPDDDHNLVIEILNTDTYIGRLKKINNEIIFQVYETDRNLNIPINWLKKIIDKAEKEL